MPRGNIVHMVSSGSARHQLGFSEGLLTGLVGCCMVACHLLNMLLAKRLPCCCKSDLRASQVGSPLFSCCGSLQAEGAAISTHVAALQTLVQHNPAGCHVVRAARAAPPSAPTWNSSIAAGNWGTATWQVVHTDHGLPPADAAADWRRHGNARSLTRAWPFGLRQLHLDLQVGCLRPQPRRACCHHPLALLPCCAGSQVQMAKPHQQLLETPPTGAVRTFGTSWSLQGQNVHWTADTSPPTCATDPHRTNCAVATREQHPMSGLVNRPKSHGVSRPIRTLNLHPAQAKYWLMHVSA